MIANAGVLLEFRGKRYLVDGIHTNHDLEFDGVPETLLERMIVDKFYRNRVTF